MKFPSLLFLVAMPWFFLSCAHKPTTRMAQSATYTQGIEVQNLIDSKGQTCSTDWQRMDWQKQLSWASSCLKSRNYLELQRWAQNSIEKNPDSPWPSYYLSLSAYEENKMNRALWFIEKSLEKSPDEGMFLYQKAKVLGKLGFSTEAEIAIQRAVDERPRIGKLLSKEVAK